MIEKKLDTRIISSYMERLSLPTTGAVPARALVLETFFRKFSPKGEQCQCDECKGISDARLSQCPFCGGSAATGDQVEADEVAAIAELVAAAGAGVQAKDAGAIALIRPVVEEAMADVEDDGKDLDILSDDMSPEQYEAKLRDAGMEIPTKATEHDLDVAVAAIRVEHRNSMMSTYSVGAWLLKVKGLRLWLLRKKKNRNSPEYTSWAQFVVAETNMTPRHANRLMATVFLYSRLQFETAGLKTLYLLIGIQDPVKRQELADLASRKELTAAQAREQVHLLSEGKPITRDVPIPGKGAFKGQAALDAKRKAEAEKPAVRTPVEEEKPKGSKGKAAPPPSIITLQVALGRTEVPLYSRGAKGAERKPAKRLADDPHGELILANGAVLRFSVQARKTGAKAGQLKLVVDVARPEDLSHGG